MIPEYFKDTKIKHQEKDKKRFINYKTLFLLSVIIIETAILIYCIALWKKISFLKYKSNNEEICTMLIRTISMQEGFHLDCEYFKNTTHVETYFNIRSLNPTNIYNYIMN